MPKKTELPELTELREEIARLDRSLVMIVAARQEAVRNLFCVKQRAGLPLFDPAQEALVVTRARRWAREVGASPADAANIFERVIEVARASATRPQPARKESGVVTVLLAMPQALPRVRVERSLPIAMPAAARSSTHGEDDADHLLGPADDHRLGADGRRPRPHSASDVPL